MGAISSPAGDVSFRRVVVFTASGTYTKPAGLRRIKILLVIGGGGGGGGTILNSISTGGNGGNGAIGIGPVVIEAALIANSVTVTVGLAGVGGGSSTAGGAGGASSFGSHATAGGGGGGGVGNPGADGANSVSVAGGLKRAHLNALGTNGVRGTDVNGTAGTGYSASGGGGDNQVGTTVKSGAAGVPGLIEIEEFF